MGRAKVMTLAMVMLASCQNLPSKLPTLEKDFVTHNVVPPIKGEVSIDDSPNGVMTPEKPTTWHFRFFDPGTGQRVTTFKPTHEKLMHLVVVKQDLSTFAHLHPTLDAGGQNPGSFQITVNLPSDDPDNADAAHAIPEPGQYLLFAEVDPGSQTRLAPMNVATPDPGSATLGIPEQPRSLAYFTKEGMPGKPGDHYQATLATMAMNEALHLQLKLRTNGEVPSNQPYEDVTDLDPWLGMTGHAFVISQAGERAQDKVFRHLHAGTQNHAGMTMSTVSHNSSGLMFELANDEVPPHGIYKVWAQVKHQGRILTLPFVITL